MGKDGDLVCHQNFRYHQEAVERAIFFLEKMANPELSIENLLDEERKRQVLENRKRLIPIIEGIILLGRQNIAFGSHRDDGFNFEAINSNKNSEGERNIVIAENSPVNYGNFKAILEYRANGDPDLREHLTTSSARSTYISKIIQNEFISIIGQEISDVIIKRVNEVRFYSIIFDETTDISRKSQMSLFIRYVFSGEIRDDFLCFIDCYKENYESEDLQTLEPTLTGKVLATTVFRALQRYSINLDNCVAIGTDGCNVMLGEQKGAVKELKDYLKNAIKSPCYNHALNLSISKTSKVQSVRNCIGTMKETISFFNMSPKRFAILKKNGNLNLIKLCETRWVERHKSIFRFCESLEVIVNALDVISNWQDTESSSKANILKSSILTTNFIVTVSSLSQVLSFTVNLSKILQSTSIDRATATDMVNQVIKTLENKRINVDKDFSEIFKNISKLHEELGIAVTKPRITGRQINRPNVVTTNFEEYYRITTYIPILEYIIEDLESRFDNDLMNILNLNIVFPTVFPKLSPREICESLDKLILFIKPFFINDPLFELTLKAEFEIWKNKFTDLEKSGSAHSLYKSCNEVFFPSIKIILQILLTFPVSVASAERSFSVLKKLKTWLRSNMTQERLCGLALMHMHRDVPIDINQVIDTFAKYKRRIKEFVI